MREEIDVCSCRAGLIFHRKGMKSHFVSRAYGLTKNLQLCVSDRKDGLRFYVISQDVIPRRMFSADGIENICKYYHTTRLAVDFCRYE